MRTSREHARLEHAQEEAGGDQAAVVLNQALHDGREPEEEHVDGEPDVGAELLEQDVGGDLEEAVRDEEDDEGVVEFCTIQV